MNFKFESAKIKQGYTHVIGCDEVGRGCLAGPVVAAAVYLPQATTLKLKAIKLAGIKDSKLLSQAQREKANSIIKKYFLWSIAEVAPQVVDKINIHNASLLAMKKAVERLPCYLNGATLNPSMADEGSKSLEILWLLPQDDASKILLALDGKFIIPKFNIEQQAIVGGDNKILSIAAASIIAKVYRDELMRKFDKQYPVYNFAEHKGYATEYHRTVISKNGVTPIHRLSFCKNLAL